MSDRWEFAGRVVRQRRQELGLTQADVQRRGGPSAATVRKLENGRADSLAAASRRVLESVLGWQQGEFDRILEGTHDSAATKTRTGHMARELFGANLERLRKQKRLSQEDVARALVEFDVDLHQTTLSKIERGVQQPRLDQMLAIARVVGTTVNELLSAEVVTDPSQRTAVVLLPNGNIAYRMDLWWRELGPGGKDHGNLLSLPDGAIPMVPDPSQLSGGAS